MSAEFLQIARAVGTCQNSQRDSMELPWSFSGYLRSGLKILGRRNYVLTENFKKNKIRAVRINSLDNEKKSNHL